VQGLVYQVELLFSNMNTVEVSVAFKFFYRDRVASPVLQPPTWRIRSPYLYPLETGWPSSTPRHQVPILVAFYDMHGLQWDYSFLWSPHGGNLIKIVEISHFSQSVHHLIIKNPISSVLSLFKSFDTDGLMWFGVENYDV
jgi:hypothetical protein